MPCNDWYEDKKVSDEVNQYTKRITDLEAVLCAILSELEKDNTFIKYVDEANKSGIFDIYDFWQKHKETDKKRLKSKLMTEFTEHERNILKQLLNE